MRIIRRNLVAHFFDKFIAGAGGQLSGGTGFDQADCLIVNGVPIPIISIIGQVMEEFEQGKDHNFVFVNLSVSNDWKGSDKKDLTLAIERSEQVRKSIQKNMKMKISLNGNMLYSIARKYNYI